MTQTRWAFDVSVDEKLEENLHISKLLQLAQHYLDRAEYEATRVLLTRASAWDIGKLELARFFINPVVKLDIDTKARWQRAEQLLIGLECGESAYAAKACSLLSQLYKQAKRPLSSLGYQLRCERLKGNATDDMVAKTLVWLHKQPVTVLEEDPHGAYIMAQEFMCYAGKAVRQWEECLLQAATEYGTGRYVGIAAQYLVEIYSAKNPEMTLKYSHMASHAGNPMILARDKEVNL